MTQPPLPESDDSSSPATEQGRAEGVAPAEKVEVEIGGRGGLDPTRYGDWEKSGRCIDF